MERKTLISAFVEQIIAKTDFSQLDQIYLYNRILNLVDGVDKFAKLELSQDPNKSNLFVYNLMVLVNGFNRVFQVLGNHQDRRTLDFRRKITSTGTCKQ